MRVCFITGTLGRGGAERQLLFMLRALQLEGIHTTVLCLTSGESFEKDVRDMGTEVVWIGSSTSRISRLRHAVGAARKVRPDIIQSSHFYTNIYAAMVGRLLGVRNIGAIRNDLHSEIAADPLFGKWQIILPEHLIANSEIAVHRALVRGLNPGKIDLVRNVVELPSNPQNRALDSDRNINVIFVGRLVQQKRPELFVKLAKQLITELPTVQMNFTIIGDGPLRFGLEKLVKDNSALDDRIRFEGELSDMPAVYSNSDILVLTSEFEGTPNVVLEAMAAGIPVVATSVGGVPEILDENFGMLVESADFTGLVEATKKMILCPELRSKFSERGREHLAVHHSTTYLRKRLIEIFQKLTHSKHNND